MFLPNFVVVTGDAYVDYHSLGTAIIRRILESKGFETMKQKKITERKKISVKIANVFGNAEMVAV